LPAEWSALDFSQMVIGDQDLPHLHEIWADFVQYGVQSGFWEDAVNLITVMENEDSAEGFLESSGSIYFVDRLK
jgi:hypothetical protein